MIETATVPFVRTFSRGGRWYVYDVHTNDLLEVDVALGRTLGALAAEQPRQALDSLTADLGREAVGGALAEVEEAQRTDGLFLSRRPALLPRRLTEADRARYETGLTHLVLIVTEDCNLVCRYCPQVVERGGRRTGSPRHMPAEVAVQALTRFMTRCRDAEFPVVSFYGGEPLLRLDLIVQVLALARAHPEWPQVRFKIDTNGTLLGDEAIDLIAREKLYLQISLDGPESVHDRWRTTHDGRGTQAAVLARLERLLRRDPSAADRICFHVTMAPPYDLDHLTAWFEEFLPYRALGIVQQPRLTASFADLTWHESAPDRVPPRQIARLGERWLQACADGRRDSISPLTRGLFDSDAIRFYHRPRSRLPEGIAPGGCCLPGVRRLTVWPDGRLEPCERGRTSLVIGQLPGWISQERVSGLVAEFDAALTDHCCNCWAVRLCGLCFASMEWDGSSSQRTLTARRCRDSRARAESMLTLYAGLMQRPGSEFLLDSHLS